MKNDKRGEITCNEATLCSSLLQRFPRSRWAPSHANWGQAEPHPQLENGLDIISWREFYSALLVRKQFVVVGHYFNLLKLGTYNAINCESGHHLAWNTRGNDRSTWLVRHHLLCLLICVWVGCGELKKYTKKRGSSKHTLWKIFKRVMPSTTLEWQSMRKFRL